MTRRFDLVKEWHVESGVGVVIDGEPLPFPVAANPVARVQPVDEYHHILWLPVMVEGPIPEYGEPDGLPATNPTPNGDLA